jgi:hypothetical protein
VDWVNLGLREIEQGGGVGRINLVQDRGKRLVVNNVVNIRVPPPPSLPLHVTYFRNSLQIRRFNSLLKAQQSYFPDICKRTDIERNETLFVAGIAGSTLTVRY